jgi:hypothetical protein
VARGGGDIKALAVDANRHDPGSGLRECTARAGITGFFEPDVVSWIEQHAADQLQSPLRAADDQHLVSRAGRAVCCLHVFRDSLPQIEIAGRIRVVELAECHRSHPPGHDLRPQRKRKPIERRHTEAERARRTTDAPRGSWRGGEREAAPGELRMFGARQAPRRRLVRQVIGQFLRDEGSRSAPRFQIPFGDQLLVRQQRRRARDAQVLRKSS